MGVGAREIEDRETPVRRPLEKGADSFSSLEERTLKGSAARLCMLKSAAIRWGSQR